jgi:DNA-binding transcriptional MerR regulator
MSKIEKEVFLTEKQVSELIQIPISTLQFWRSKKSNLPFAKYGKYVRYPKSEVLKKLMSSMVEVRNE